MAYGGVEGAENGGRDCQAKMPDKTQEKVVFNRCKKVMGLCEHLFEHPEKLDEAEVLIMNTTSIASLDKTPQKRKQEAEQDPCYYVMSPFTSLSGHFLHSSSWHQRSRAVDYTIQDE